MTTVMDTMGTTELNENARCANLLKSSRSPDDETARASSPGSFGQELGNAFCMGIGRKTDLTDPVPLFLVALGPSFRPAVISVHFGSFVFWGSEGLGGAFLLCLLGLRSSRGFLTAFAA